MSKTGLGTLLGLMLVVPVASETGWPQEPSPSPTPLPSPVILGDYDEAPRVKKVTRPKYPAEAFRRGVAGTVLLRFVIDEKGKVQEARVIRGVPGLDEAAVETIKGWRFFPAKKSGHPVRVITEAPVTFKIF